MLSNYIDKNHRIYLSLEALLAHMFRQTTQSSLNICYHGIWTYLSCLWDVGILDGEQLLNVDGALTKDMENAYMNMINVEN